MLFSALAQACSQAARDSAVDLDAEYRALVDGYNAETGARQIAPRRVAELLAEEPARVVMLDIREADEIAVSRIRGARHVPPGAVNAMSADELSSDLAPDAIVVTYCTAGYRSGIAAVALEESLGRQVFNLDGGLIAWFNAGREVVDPNGIAVDRIHAYGPAWETYVVPRKDQQPPRK